jgi:hypothetical protein
MSCCVWLARYFAFVFSFKKTKSMQPKDFHEELASSAEKVEKRKRRQPPLSERVLVCDTPEMKDDDDKLERLRVSVL